MQYAKTRILRNLISFTFLLISCFVTNVYSDSVLVINVHGKYYDNEGESIHNTLVNLGIDSTFVNLKSDTQSNLITMLNSSTFDQIWVFDLSHDSAEEGTLYLDSWNSIANWFLEDTNRGIICDARMISSYMNELWKTEGQNLSENYYTHLKNSNGGLLLATDHDVYHPGINKLNALIGLNPFSGEFLLDKIPVDVNSPLMNTPNILGEYLSDDSSPGQVPFGLQPNGLILYAVAWHGGNYNTPGISATIKGKVGFQIKIDHAEEDLVFFQCQTITFTSSYTSTSNDDTPINTNWSSSIDGNLGNESTIEVSSLSIGKHLITLQSESSLGGADSATITVDVKELPQSKLYTEEEVNLLIRNLLEFDCDNNGKIGIIEAIKALRVAAGMK